LIEINARACGREDSRVMRDNWWFIVALTGLAFVLGVQLLLALD
jgi:hypothetical protein